MPDWQTQFEKVASSGVRRIQVNSRGDPLTFAAVIDLWAGEADFRAYFSDLLAHAIPGAFFWEMPPLTLDTLDLPFEFVLVPSPTLTRLEPDPAAFIQYFRKQPEEQVVVFENLGGDAVLVVPAPQTSYCAYLHLAAFTRDAPGQQQHILWRTVSDVLRNNLTERRTWLSTAGLGVPWLHLRLDSHPKYYRHQPYKSAV